MAANEIRWVQATNSTVITSASPADDAGALSSEVTNAANLDRWCKLSMNVNITAASPATTGPLEVFVVYDLNGTYEYGSASVKPGYQSKVADVVIQDDTNDQQVQTPMFPVLPYDHKFVIWNSSGEALSDLDVDAYYFNEEVE